MADAPKEGPLHEGPLPPSLRFLKTLVTALTLSMIGGVIAITVLLVTRLPGAGPTLPVLPDAITLPAGETAMAVTFGKGWIAVVTESEKILILAPDGSLRQSIDLVSAP